MSDMSDNRLNDPQQMEDDLNMAGERVEPERGDESTNVDAAEDAEGERTGVLGDPLDENIGEDTGMLE
ncbi:hypothetical protein ASC66_09005 [Leifsonia sp. Root4]|uniref:hypothetical protein n=1 Tax=Leifsonia sp. Root4 TaxID=1736525 RepID=UPI0006F68600|nr:hypothetical protein [Leifsonia sp. Root4]KQW06591.1 hypothetical protein ASC66_09005 [Leifsonia sp. Root4]